MRLKSVAIYAVVVTGLCLLFVRQQVQIVKLSYKLRDQEKSLTQTIDRNRVLLYNNTSLKAPKYLATMLRENNMELALPETTAVAKVRVLRKQTTQLAKSTNESWKTHFLDLFVPKAQAASGLRR